MSNLSHRDASELANLLFPVSGSWSKLLSLEYLLMHREARVEQVAVRPLVFLDLRLCLRHRDTRCNVGSGRCDSRALVLPNETGMIGTKVISQC